MSANESPQGASRGHRVRLFFAAWPPKAAAEALHRYASELGTNGRVMPKENLHLTLAFLGETAMSRVPRAIEAAGRLMGFAHRLVLDEVQYRRRSEIVWAESTTPPAALLALAEALAHTLARADFALEHRRFAAHVTLIRGAQKPQALPPVPAIDWPVDDFALVRSTPSEHGSRYEILERFALAPR